MCGRARDCRLRRRGIDLVTADEQGLLGASDAQHLKRATELDRVIVSADRDFFAIVSELLVRGESFPGLLFVQPHATVGETVRMLTEAAQFLEPEAIANTIEWIP